MSPRANRSWKSLMPQGFAVLSAAIVISAAFSTALHVQARVDDEPETTAASPYSEPQYATLTATTNTINVTMLPVVESNGTVVYYNLTIPIKTTETVSGTKATITLAAGTVTQVASPISETTSFKPGTYAGPSTVLSGDARVTVSNPGLAPGGATEWSLGAAAGAANCTYPATANWYVASPTATNNPLAPRLKLAGITASDTGYQYGTTGSQNCIGGQSTDYLWYPNSLIGVTQNGSNLTIVTFTDGNGHDHNTAQDTITYAPYTPPAN